MKTLDTFQSIIYLVEHNPVCGDCARGNLEELRKSAGLYQVIKDMVASGRESYSIEELDAEIQKATTF